MEIYLKAVCVVLLSSVFCLVLSRQCKDISVALIICVVCLVVAATATYLTPIIEFINRLIDVGELNPSLLSVLLKAVGIALISEVVSLVCKDAGTVSIGKALQILTTSIILWLSIPLFNELLDLIETILDCT